jgi:two-component system response regulator HydG
MTSAAADKLLSYPWPGNVRELQNCIERAVALAQFDQIGVDDLPEKIRDYKTARISIESNDPAELLPMEEVERRYILKVLEAVGGNKTLAAQVLGFDRRTLYRKLDRVRDPSPREKPPSGDRHQAVGGASSAPPTAAGEDGGPKSSNPPPPRG